MQLTRDIPPKVLIVTPLLPPAPGGGGIYTQLLSNGLIRGGFAGQVIILTEGFPGVPARSSAFGGAIDIRRQFPFRAGASRKGVSSYAKYLVQNLQLLGLPALVRREQIDVVLFHASLLYHPGVSTALVKRSAPRSRSCWIADVRDPRLQMRKFEVLYPFDAIIACSENVLDHLGQDPVLAAKTHLVPIPAAVVPPGAAARASVMARFGLEPRSYVFSSSGIVVDKGIDDAIAVVRIARAAVPELKLVIVGKDRDRRPVHDAAIREGVLQYLGSVDHETSLALAAEAVVDLNLSRVDSMPRGSLESLLAGTPILVPRGIPELESCCPESVVDAKDPDEVARRILALRKARVLPRYDTGAHDVAQVARATAEVFAWARAARGNRSEGRSLAGQRFSRTGSDTEAQQR